VLAQFLHEGMRGLDVEQAGLQRDQHAVGDAHHRIQPLAVQPAGVSSTTCVVPLGGRTMSSPPRPSR
jgi:hypothetical protein